MVRVKSTPKHRAAVRVPAKSPDGKFMSFTQAKQVQMVEGGGYMTGDDSNKTTAPKMYHPKHGWVKNPHYIPPSTPLPKKKESKDFAFGVGSQRHYKYYNKDIKRPMHPVIKIPPNATPEEIKEITKLAEEKAARRNNKWIRDIKDRIDNPEPVTMGEILADMSAHKPYVSFPGNATSKWDDRPEVRPVLKKLLKQKGRTPLEKTSQFIPHKARAMVLEAIGSEIGQNMLGERIVTTINKENRQKRKRDREEELKELKKAGLFAGDTKEEKRAATARSVVLMKETMAEQDAGRTGNELYYNRMFELVPDLPSDSMRELAPVLDVALLGRLKPTKTLKKAHLYNLESGV